MALSNRHAENRYRLVVADGARGEAAEVAEVRSHSPEAALHLAGRLYPGRIVEVFEDDHPLARVRTARDAGYWIIEHGQRK